MSWTSVSHGHFAHEAVWNETFGWKNGLSVGQVFFEKNNIQTNVIVSGGFWMIKGV